MITMGKFRHLSRTTTTGGHFLIMAIDHRTNLLEVLNQHAPTALSDADFVVFKQRVLRSVVPYASGLLTDPAYGIGAGIVTGVIPGGIGLLAPIEVTDYGLHPSQRSMQVIPDWSVKKIKMVGGDGVKLLLPYHPEAGNVAEKYAFVERIVADCATYDIPFFLEPIPYSLDPDVPLINDELLQITVEMCRTFSKMGADILKLAFPVDHKQSDDESEWLEACQAVTEACSVPWALLSAGVNFDTFLRQSKIACQAGASGVIAGRAVWAEAVKLQGQERTRFLAEVTPERMRRLAEVCAAHATPWQERIQIPDSSINWYQFYQG